MENLIRVTVAELYNLQESIEKTGEVHAAILPIAAYSSTRLVVAWARSVNGETFCLAIWRDAESWEGKKRELEDKAFTSNHSPDPDNKVAVNFMKLDREGQPYGIGTSE